MVEIILGLLGGAGRLIGAAFAWLAKLPWYVLVIAALVALLVWCRWTAHNELAKDDRTIARQARGLELFKAADETNHRSLDTYAKAVKLQNDALQTYRVRMAQASAQAAQARAQAAREAIGRDKAIAVLKRAPRITQDVQATDAHNQVRSQL